MRFFPDADIGLQLDRILNEGLTFVDNFDAAILELTTTGAEQTVSHTLGRVPIGLLVIYKSGACDVWGTQLASWTNEQLSLQASVASVDLRLLVM